LAGSQERIGIMTARFVQVRTEEQADCR